MLKLSLKNTPFDHDLIKNRVRRLNREAGSFIRSKLGSYDVYSERLCICAVGSDGRLEKGEASPIEIMLLHRDLDAVRADDISQLARCVLESEAAPIAGESKSLQMDEITYAFGDHRRPYPSRVLDSAILYGNPELLSYAKAKMLDEWFNPEGKRIVKTIKERRADARRTMLSGRQKWKGHEVTHFDIGSGKAFYDNANGVQIRSVKPGPLRFVQTVIELGVVMLGREMARQGKRSAMVGILEGLPTPTIDKLEYLSDVGLVTLEPSDIEKICDCYLSFLRLYNASERMFVEAENVVRFDPREAKERIGLLNALLEKPLIRE
jgi:hypothetical protein